MQNRVQILAFDQDSITIQGTFGININTSQRINGNFTNSSAANGDQINFIRYFSKGGLYKARMVYATGGNQAIIAIGLDSNATAIMNQDSYKASGANNTFAETLVEIARGYHTITIKANGKNASSGGYGINFSLLELDLVQEYPVYQDDKPAQINQGSMVLLGKHIAQVAESTFTFNLANVDLVNVYSDIIIKIKGGSTASFALKLQLNGDSGTNYNLQADRIIAGAVAFINLTGQTSVQLASTSLITGANVGFTIDAWIKEELPTSIGRMDVTYLTNSNGAVMERGAGTHADTLLGKLSSLTILTSTSTWLAGTQFEIYGVKKQ